MIIIAANTPMIDTVIKAHKCCFQILNVTQCDGKTYGLSVAADS